MWIAIIFGSGKARHVLYDNERAKAEYGKINDAAAAPLGQLSLPESSDVELTGGAAR